MKRLAPPLPYTQYTPENLEVRGTEVVAWGTGKQRLSRVVGRPRALRVKTAQGIQTVVRLGGRAALWQAAAEWGTLTDGHSVAVVVRVQSAKGGTLYDGSTRTGSAPITLPGGPPRWQVLVFRNRTKPLGGLILGADVATQNGLACDLAEVQVFDHALSDAEERAVIESLETRWENPMDLPDPPQPQAPPLFRTVVRKQGDDGVHTYRIPGLATSTKGTLLAVFDCRNQSSGDLPANIDVGLMRSDDDGKTWGKLTRILDYGTDGVGDPAILVDKQTGRVFVVALYAKGNRAWVNSGPGLTPEETGQLVLTYSDDDGRTWSKPRSLTPEIKKPEWRLLFNGPGAGIQTKDGTLVFAAQFKGGDNIPHSCLLLSKDHGTTWTLSPPALPTTPPTSEAQVAELSDGSLLLTMRNEARTGVRAWGRWDTKAERWTETWLTVPEPTCMASLLRHPSGMLLFTNPNDTKRRVNLTLRTSTDNGKTWSDGTLLDPRLCSYSCMTVLRDGSIGILYEVGEDTIEETLTFARIPPPGGG